ncbi:MAG: hypothetical protein U5L74_15345 [Ideonella sp.]|nr:hypothetical protein [Ideonella sp.]
MKLRPFVSALILMGAVGLTQAQAVRPEVGKPLKEASDLLKAGKAREALGKANAANAVGGKTAAEQFTIDRMRAAAAQRAGDNGAAADAMEDLMNSGKLSAAEQAQTAESLAYAYSQLRNNAKATQWVSKAQSLGNNSATLKQLQAYLQANSGDYGAIAKDAAAAVSAAEQAGRRPDENDLLRLADAYSRTNNAAGQAQALDKLVTYYPKKDYWAAALGRLPRKPGFSDRFSLDVMRLKLATGNLEATNDYMEMSQLALQAGCSAEAKQVVDKGFAAGALGTGTDAERHKRLKALVDKRDAEDKASFATRLAAATAAKDGNALVQLGQCRIGAGDATQAETLIAQGIAKGQLKRPDDAKLALGRAQLAAKQRPKAQQTLRGLQGTDGIVELARYYQALGH